ncbi:SpoIIIAH-like family protein [Desulfitobacterium sp. AusDCA]|uniref:SpoIIIAH-like family protein n=1 Tax=Desulfitobacterium sp. AusDCA TaxID=3240383 RepID=UPI003DA7984D
MHILIHLPQSLSNKRVRVGILSGSIFFIIGLLIVGWALTKNQPTHFTGKNTLAVNAQIEGQNIQFSSEAAKPKLQGQNYFVNYRLQREQSRQEEKSMLSAVLNSNIAATKEDAQKKWLQLTNRISKEDEIENLLKIKGFQDAIAEVAPNSVNVFIYAPSVTPNEISIIQNIVQQATSVHLDQINISVRNP